MERIRIKVTDDVKSLALHTDVFDGFLRHLAAIFETDGLLAEETFWTEVARCLAQHEESTPSSRTRWRRTTCSGRSSTTAA